MYKKKLNEDIRCPLDYGMNLIAGKWKSRILCLIGNTGPMHFGELKSELVNISDGVLASTLNSLIESDLIRKSIAEEKQPSAYSLTAKSDPLIPVLQDMCRWAAPYYKKDSGLMTGRCQQCDFYRKWSEETYEE